MFTLPPRPPKDYILKNVPNTQASAPEFTPSALPRATQTTLRKYCYPIPADDNEPQDQTAIEQPNDKILNRWATEARAWWLDKPEKNAYFLHDVFKKYSVVVDPDYDPRYQHKPRVFQRSYKFELDCVENSRLKKLWAKTQFEEDEENRKQEKRTLKEKAKEKPLIEIVPCKLQPPFWWKTSVDNNTGAKVKPDLDLKPSQTVYQTSYLRWQDKPKLFEASQTDPCKRRDALAQYRQPYKHAACTWYFENYPPPKIKFHREKFS